MDISQPRSSISAAQGAAAAAWFGPVPPEIGPPPPTGFSGASLAVIRPRGAVTWYVLKAFAAGTKRSRAEWVHALVRHLADRGVAEVPAPVATPTGATVVTDARGVHWELLPCVAGAAVEAPSVAQAEAALEALARLHVAATTLPGAAPRVGLSPGVARRIAQARELVARPWHVRRAACRAIDAFTVDVAGRWDRALAVGAGAVGERAVAAVAQARATDAVLQPVLRDVWQAHVLFAPGLPPRIAGIVDAHAAGIDSPAADLARLVGSWRPVTGELPGDPAAAWPEALAAYAAVRPLGGAERGLVPFLHAAGVVLGLDNWFRWTLEERRPFATPPAVLARIDRLLDDLPAAVAWLGERGEIRV